MACQPPRMLEALSCVQARVRRTQPGPTAAAGPVPAPPSCKQPLGSGPKVFGGRSLAPGPAGQRSCQQQLGFGTGLYLATRHAPTTLSGNILPTTSLWFAGRGGLILQTCRTPSTPRPCRTSNSAFLCWIICSNATGQGAAWEAAPSSWARAPYIGKTG